MIIFANCKWWCCGNFSNLDKLPGELHPVVFGFVVTLVSINGNSYWHIGYSRPKLFHLPQFSTLVHCTNQIKVPKLQVLQLQIPQLNTHVQSHNCKSHHCKSLICKTHHSCSICLNSALFVSLQHLSTLYIPNFVLQNWFMCTKLISVTPVGWILHKMAYHCVILGWVQSLSHFVLCHFSDNFC